MSKHEERAPGYMSSEEIAEAGGTQKRVTFVFSYLPDGRMACGVEAPGGLSLEELAAVVARLTLAVPPSSAGELYRQVASLVDRAHGKAAPGDTVVHTPPAPGRKQ